MTQLTITGGQVLLADGTLARTELRLEDGRIAAIGAPAAGRRLDASGLLVLPGIVDLHGDAFERQIQPRPGVGFPVNLALRDTESQLLACGVTTALHAVTLSWEPGLRSPQTWRAIVDGLEAMRPAMACDMRVHMRWEQHNLDALDMALDDIEAGRVHLLSFNDHTPEILRRMDKPAAAAAYGKRAMMGVAEFRVLAERAAARGPEVPAATQRLAEAARRRHVPMASHDDDTVAVRDGFRAMGARICEFPMADEVGLAARRAGDAVVMGCPNVVRGGSHLGWASAGSLAGRDVCTVLCSDYFYPAMLNAALMLGDGPLGLARAWALVSANPAEAAGLDDRGRIAPGQRADLVLLDPDSRAVVATLTGGAPAYLGRSGAARLH